MQSRWLGDEARVVMRLTLRFEARLQSRHLQARLEAYGVRPACAV